jgi:integrase
MISPRKRPHPPGQLFNYRLQLLPAGENPKIVSERLGHASINLTMDTYSHVLPDMQKKAAEKMEDMLFGKY